MHRADDDGGGSFDAWIRYPSRRGSPSSLSLRSSYAGHASPWPAPLGCATRSPPGRSVVAEAVTCEPVSATNSLISGNLLGKFAVFGSSGGMLRQIDPNNPALSGILLESGAGNFL